MIVGPLIERLGGKLGALIAPNGDGDSEVTPSGAGHHISERMVSDEKAATSPAA